MASGNTLQSTIEIAGVLSPSLQKAIKAAVNKLEDLSEETLDSVGAAEKLSAEISAQEDVLKSLRKGYADFVVSGQDSSEEARTLSDKIQKLSSELDENKSSLAAAERAVNSLTDEQDDGEVGFKDLGDAAEKAGDQVEDSSGGYTILKDVIADLVSDALDWAIESFKELATEGDSTLGLLQARTGATTREMEGFEDVMYDVYNANYGDSLGEVGDTLSTVIQMTDDLDNASLAQITKNTLTLDKVFGFDTTESLRAMNSLMDQFGITSEEAFNLIVQGAQNGLDQNGDMLDTINEYSVQFEAAGFSADEMFNMLANGAAEGTWSVDKLGDAVKEYNIRMSDGTATEALMKNRKALGLTKAEAQALASAYGQGGEVGAAAMQQTLDAIMAVEDENARYQLGVEMFGTMWEDLGEDAVVALFNTEGAISSANDAMDNVDAAAYDTLEGALSALGRTISAEVVQPLVKKLTPAIKKAVQFVTSKVGPAVDWVLEHLPEIGIALGTVGAAIAAMKWGSIVTQFGKVSGVFSKFKGLLAGVPGPVWAVIAVIGALAAGFVHLWNTNEEFRDEVTAIWAELQTSFSELGGQIMGMIEQLMPLFSEIATTVLTAFADIAAAVIPILLQIIAEILPVIIDLISQLLPIIMQVVMAVLPVLVDFINQLLPVIVQIVQAVLPVLLQLVQTLLPIFMQIVNAVLPILVQLINTLLPVILQIVNAVLPILVQILNLLTPILDLIISLLQPILDLFVAIVTPILNLIMTAITPLIDIFTLLITSVLTPIQPILTVLGEIFTATLGSAIQNVTPLVEALQTVFSGLATFISGVFAGDWSTAWSGIVETFGGLWDGLVALVKAPINGVIGLINSAIGALNNISVDIPEWVPGFGGSTFGLDIPTIPLLAAGGFTDGVSIAGEAGTEAVVSFDPAYRQRNIGIWEKAGQMLGVLDNEASGAELTRTAGRLLTLDSFSLGNLAGNGGVVIYYDFSGFTWSPQIHTGDGTDEDDFMAKLKAHEAEFFEWLEEFIHMREEAQYA